MRRRSSEFRLSGPISVDGKGVDDLDLAKQFLKALETAANTGDKEPVYPSWLLMSSG